MFSYEGRRCNFSSPEQQTSSQTHSLTCTHTHTHTHTPLPTHPRVYVCVYACNAVLWFGCICSRMLVAMLCVYVRNIEKKFSSLSLSLSPCLFLCVALSLSLSLSFSLSLSLSLCLSF